MHIRQIVRRDIPVAAPASAASNTPAKSKVADPDSRAILNSIGETVYDWDMVTDALVWGPNYREVLGESRGHAIDTGRGYGDHVSADSVTSRYNAIMSSGGTDNGAGVVFQTRYGLLAVPSDTRSPRIWVEDTGRWFAGPDGRPARAHGLVRVVTQQYEAERDLTFRSHFDPLTGALNRARFVEIVSTLIERTSGTSQAFCVLLIGIENLFLINRSYGYDVADEMIAAVADRLRIHMRAADTLARYAGNKFALVLDACDPQQMLIAAQRFHDVVGDLPLETHAGTIPASVRIGGVIAPRHGRSPHVLMQHAEEALDLAREPNAPRFVAWEPSLQREDARSRTLRIADDIVSALNDNRVLIALQPIVDANTRTPVIHEALLRLQARDGALVPPGAILPVAEKNNLVHMLDQRVFELALAQLELDANLILSVNLSVTTLIEPDWPVRLAAALALHKSCVPRLIIEITETAAIENLDAVEAAVKIIKSHGLRVAIDDFGAGHTSFRNLRRLSFDIIKMDGAFMQNLSRSADDRFFVRTLIDLARHLDVKIVAEWVEDEETARALASWGVDYLQGDLFGAAAVRDSAAQSAITRHG